MNNLPVVSPVRSTVRLTVPRVTTADLATSCIADLRTTNPIQRSRILTVLKSVLNGVKVKASAPVPLNKHNLMAQISKSALHNGTVLALRISDDQSVYFSLRNMAEGDYRLSGNVRGFISIPKNFDKQKLIAAVVSLHEVVFGDLLPVNEDKLSKLKFAQSNGKTRVDINPNNYSAKTGITFESAILSILYRLNNAA